MELEGRFASYMTNRQLKMLSQIVKEYQLSPKLQEKIRKWIIDGTLAENAMKYELKVSETARK